jgi:hypothetical protein
LRFLAEIGLELKKQIFYKVVSFSNTNKISPKSKHTFESSYPLNANINYILDLVLYAICSIYILILSFQQWLKEDTNMVQVFIMENTVWKKKAYKIRILWQNLKIIEKSFTFVFYTLERAKNHCPNFWKKKSLGNETMTNFSIKETRICIKNTFFKEKLFTTEVQGILKGAWLVRRL